MNPQKNNISQQSTEFSRYLANLYSKPYVSYCIHHKPIVFLLQSNAFNDIINGVKNSK